MGSDDDQELHKVKIKEVLMPQFPGEVCTYDSNHIRALN